MTKAPGGGKRIADDLPEPPLDTLYDLYLRSLTYDRRQWMARLAADQHLEEQAAMLFQPKSRDRFRAYLDECDRRGSRAWAVNCLVLGPEYCDAHPDDPRIQPPPSELTDERAAVLRCWERAVGRRPAGPSPGRG